MFELPSVLAYPLFYKLVAPEASLVSKAAMQAWVVEKQLVSLDAQSRMMEVLCRRQRCDLCTCAIVSSLVTGVCWQHTHEQCLHWRSSPRQHAECNWVLRAIHWVVCGRLKLEAADLYDAVGMRVQVLCRDGATSVTQADLKSMMAGILLSHPGLEFLQDTPEFQDRHVLSAGMSQHGVKLATRSHL